MNIYGDIVIRNAITSGYVEISEIPSQTNPINTHGRLYKKTANSGIFWLPDSAGVEIDLTNGPVIAVKPSGVVTNYNITGNAFSVGPVSIQSGVSVTVAGGRWVII